MLPLEGHVALVTGSSRGIGHAIAERLARDGADLAIHGRRPGGASGAQAEALAETARGLGRRAACFHADIADRQQVAALFEAVGAAFGKLDVLVLNAARAPFKDSARMLERDWRLLMDTNFLGPVTCVQRALPLFPPEGARLVFVSSLGSRFMNPQYPLGPMKAAMEAQVRQWAEELRDRGVRSNAVCAGLVKTDAYKTLRRVWPELAQVPEAAFVEPAEVADVVAFLAGPGARAITGQTLIVDRGLSNRLMRPPPD